MGDGPLGAWRSMVASGALKPDSSQGFVAEEFQILCGRLERLTSGRSDFFSRFLPTPPAPQGLYLFGGVGAGKTMLMDLFFRTCRFESKRRIHFQAFMSETHGSIAAARRAHIGDPVAIAAEDIAAEAQLLCIDEFEVRDIADAMILSRLFAQLFDSGLVLVATSNTAPRDLYRDGLNRPLFAPFVGMLESRCEIVALEAAEDYRRGRLQGSPLWFTPADDAASAALAAAFFRLTGGVGPEPEALNVRGRTLDVKQCAMGVARFSFAELCEAPLGSDDYRAIAQTFHTVLIDGVPALSPERRDAARRFVTLIDALYDQGTGLIASAAAEPDALFPHGDGAAAFKRTASRLIEMRSSDLRGRRASPTPQEGGLAVVQSFGQTSSTN